MFKHKSKIFRCCLIGYIAYIGILSFIDESAFNSKITAEHIAFYNEQKVNFRGIILGEPDKRIDHIKLTVTVEKLISNGADKPAAGRVLVSAPLYPEYQYGDELEISCYLKAPEPFEGFRYDRYLAKDDVYSLCSYPKIKLLSKNNGDWLFGNLYRLKNKLLSLINSNLPEPQASLFSAVFLGSRRGVPAELTEKFSLTGTSHLIAISGLHITIITTILIQIALACYLPRRISFWLVSGILFFYLTIIGFPPSAIRACIMGWISMLAIYLGRLNRSENALLLAASIMIFINPKILRDDIGFQLSFSAVLGLIYISPWLDRWFEKVPNTLGLRDSLQMSTAAQISTLPLIVLYFGRLALIGPIVNVLILPALPYLMIVGFAALGASLILAPLSQYLFLPVWLMLSYIIEVIELFSLIPYGSINF